MTRAIRRTWFRLSILVAILGLGFVSGCRSRAREGGASQAGRPDIVLVSLDTVRQDRGPGAWGAGVMPNFAALAASGVRFAEAWAPASNTLVSHGSLFTGLEPWHHRFDPGLPPPADPPTLMPMLHQAGYSTAVFTTLPIWLGHAHHFDAGADVFHSELAPGEKALEWVRDWLATNPPHPRALFVHLYDAHSDTDTLPYEAPELPPAARAFAGCVGELCASRLLKAVDDGAVNLPTEAPAAIGAAYSAGVTAADALLGRLLRMLEPGSQRALVAVFSDHGELLGEEGWLHHGSSPAVLDIPLAVRWPDGPTGVVSEVPVSLVDLYPTVLEAAGIPQAGRPGLRSRVQTGPGGKPGGPQGAVQGAGGAEAERTVVAMGAARRGKTGAYMTRAGSIKTIRRDAQGLWEEVGGDVGLEALVRSPEGTQERPPP